LKDGSFACKWHKVPNILQAKMCFQKKKKKLWNVLCEEATLRSLELIFFMCLQVLYTTQYILLSLHLQASFKSISVSKVVDSN
jgi:hypothetical protein